MTPVVICPTITATDTHQYREQVERVAPFAQRIHIDLMDGVFAPTVSPSLHHIWWPEGIVADIHLMYQRPLEHLDELLVLRPHLVIVPFEAEGDFALLATQLHSHDIEFGIALLPATDPAVAGELIKLADHVLIFSGHLGYHGGKADMALTSKVRAVQQLNPRAEIAWDGGISDANAAELIQAGIEVLNVGGFVQNTSNPQAAYAKLEELVRINP